MWYTRSNLSLALSESTDLHSNDRSPLPSPPPSSPPLPSFCCGLQDSPSTLEEVAPFAQGLLRGTVELVKLDNDAIRIQVLEALTVIISVRGVPPGAPHPPPILFYSAHLSCLSPLVCRLPRRRSDRRADLLWNSVHNSLSSVAMVTNTPLLGL